MEYLLKIHKYLVQMKILCEVTHTDMHIHKHTYTCACIDTLIHTYIFIYTYFYVVYIICILYILYILNNSEMITCKLQNSEGGVCTRSPGNALQMW